MAEKIFNQEFSRYYREIIKGSLPKKSGVYIVQSCTYNAANKTVDLKKLIYIGKADDIRHRVINHEKLEKWIGKLKKGEILCYNFTLVPKKYYERVEAALINKNQPIVNVEYKKSFPFDTTIVNCSNNYDNLKEKIRVIRR